MLNIKLKFFSRHFWKHCCYETWIINWDLAFLRDFFNGLFLVFGMILAWNLISQPCISSSFAQSKCFHGKLGPANLNLKMYAIYQELGQPIDQREVFWERETTWFIFCITTPVCSPLFHCCYCHQGYIQYVAGCPYCLWKI